MKIMTDIIYIVPIIAIFLTLIIYTITKIFTLKEYREKKREAMFNWVHENLIEDVYIPLTEYTEAISYELSSQKTCKKEIVLYHISKFLHYVSKNREIFGGYIYFTPHKKSNRLLENISEKIRSEIDTIYDLQGDKNPTERRIVILEFLATCAKCRNYFEFKSLIRGRPIFNNDLTDEINKLKDAYTDDYYLLFGCSDHTDMLLNPIDKLINPKNLGQTWRKAKLYAYCSLFSKLLTYEIHKIYDSWYVEPWYAKYPDTREYHQLVDVIDLVNCLVAETDMRLVDGYKLREKSYHELSVNTINTLLDLTKQGLSSTAETSKKIELNKEINRLETLKSIELLSIISPRKINALKTNRSEEFYKNVADMELSKNSVIKNIKSKYYICKMIKSHKKMNYQTHNKFP